MSEWKELTKDSFTEVSDLIDKYATAKDWEKFDELFESDKYLHDEAGYTLIIYSRFYDHWLTKRHSFLDRFAISSPEDLTEEMINKHRLYKYSPDNPMFAFFFTTPKGFIDNPDLLDELNG